MGTGVLITDGMERAALATARSLAAAGYEVHIAAPTHFSLAGVSRGVRRCTVGPDPLGDPAGYAGAIGRLARERGIEILLPLTDASVEALLEHRPELPSGIVLPLPPLDAYRRASDKLAMLDLARASGLDVPETIVVQSPTDVPAPARIPFPIVVKPHRSVVMDGARRCKTGVTIAGDAAALARALRELPAAAFPVLLQRRIGGPGEGLFALRWDGRMRAVFAHRRLREKPPTGGVSVYRESIAPPPELVHAGTRLLEALDWRGVAMIECKRDAATGRHVLMEVNGRFWGSLQLAIDAGVDFPALLVACALDRANGGAGSSNGYRVGIRSRWFWGDVDHLYLRLKGDRGVASRLRALLAFLAIRPGRDRSEVWRWRDPAPFVVETLQRLGLLA